MSDEEWKTLVGDLHRAGNNLRHEGFLVDAATADAAGSAITNLLSALTDPIAVHANMLRGTIAKPTLEQIIHLYNMNALMKTLTPMIVQKTQINETPKSEHDVNDMLNPKITTLKGAKP